jgi:hypothetical protein
MHSIHALNKVTTLVKYNLEYKYSIFKRLFFATATKLYLHFTYASTLLTL